MDKYYKIFSRQECPPSHVFQEYIKGTLSPVETHAFEKHLIDCTACDEVLEGMKMYESDEFAKDLKHVHQRIDKKKENSTIWYAAAATVSLLIVSALLLVSLFKVQKQDLSMEDTKVSAPASSPIPAPTDSENKSETYEPYVVADQLPESEPSPSLAPTEQKEAPMSDNRGPLPVVEQVKEADVSSSDIDENVEANSSLKSEEMQTDTVNKQLDEVVVVGYGTVKKSDLTGSVSSLKDSKFKDIRAKKAQELMPLPYASINALIQSGNLDSASTEIEKVLIKNPSDEDALWLKADVLIKNNLKVEAEKILHKLVDSKGIYAKRAKKRMKGL